ncbi:MAG: hypothetical protein HGA31_05705 [Candidatus Moranbacteria bacterium]|nr:hypothetical protein [Candidatus Moranbacteria bacterium]
MITSHTKPVTALSQSERDDMYSLLSGHFLGTVREDFERDLAEKECVMFLREGAGGKIVGFSTLVCFSDIRVGTKEVAVIFSGDTVVLERYRSSFGFGAEIARYFETIRERYPDRESYYVLTSKGWRTYKILPFFFKSFYPNHRNDESSEIRGIMDAFCMFKFPEYYDERRGVLTSTAERQRLRPETGDCALPDRDDPNILYFAERNPGYLEGDELVCIASIAGKNLADGMLRFTRKSLPSLEKESVSCEGS